MAITTVEEGTETLGSEPAAEAAVLPSQPQAFLKVHAKSLVVLVVVALLAFGYIHQMQATNALREQNKKLSSPAATAQAEAATLKSQVAKLVELPSDEVPTIATVSDVTKLQSQAFFKNAKNGDKVLMFTKAKEAVLYRPSDNKIIQMAPLDVSGSTTKQ